MSSLRDSYDRITEPYPESVGEAPEDGQIYGRKDGEWEAVASGGDMQKSVYDPTNANGDTFNRSNHTGTQTASTISDFENQVNIDLQDYKINGRYFLQFTVTNAIPIADGVEYNLFNNTDGMLSSNGTLTTTGDAWDQPVVIDSEYLTPDTYTDTDTPYADIETAIFLNVPVSISGTTVRPVCIEVRRRTSGSPTVPLAIPGREVEKLVNNNVTVLSTERLPTRSSGSSDNYYVYGFAPFLINDTGSNITIPAASIIRIEVFNSYRKPIKIS